MDRLKTVALEMARRPVPGRVKTRLAATEGEVEAARIYGVLARDVHATLLALQDADRLVTALCLPEEDVEAPWLPGARHVWSQGGGDLGARMARCFRQAFATGAERVFAVGTDIVGLSAERVGVVLDALDGAGVVVAPTPDGGYGLIGVRATVAEQALHALFDDVPWSTSAVMQTTRERAAAAGLRLVEIEGLRDVDVAADLPGAIPLLSVIVPVLDEAPHIEQHVAALMAQARALAPDVEVIVSDGGSVDDSAARAEALGAVVVHAARGRGTQLRGAAEIAKGRWLWTLHADAGLPAGGLAGVVRYCRRGARPWANCASRFDHPSWWLRFQACLTDGRARLLRLPYGDQGILVQRALYDAVGGYADIPLMEDVALARSLARYGEPGHIPVRLRVDARRWRHHGVLRTTVRNLVTLFRFLALGTDPHVLAAGYRRGEPAGAE